jgi:hypothetical protein
VNGSPICAVREWIGGDLVDITCANQALKLFRVSLFLGVILVDSQAYLEEIILENGLFSTTNEDASEARCCDWAFKQTVPATVDAAIAKIVQSGTLRSLCS